MSLTRITDVGRAIVLAALCLVLLTSCGRRYYSWNSQGPVQVLVSPSEMWVFWEFDRQVRQPNGRFYPVGHQQYVSVLTPDGGFRHFFVKGGPGVTFHPNISKIFRRGKTFALFEDECRNNLPTLYIWKEGRFVKQGLAESKEFAATQPKRWSEVDLQSSTPAEPGAEEWRRVLAVAGLADPDTDRFPWGDAEVRLRFLDETDTQFRVAIEIHRGGEKRTHVIPVPRQDQVLSKREYQAIQREESGHPKQGR